MRYLIPLVLLNLLALSAGGRISAEEYSKPQDQPEVRIHDKRVNAAYKLATELEWQELTMAAQLERLFQKTQSNLQNVNVETLQHVQPTLDGLAETSRRLQETGEELVAEFQKFRSTHTSYWGATTRAPEAYRGAADAAREWAKEAKSQAFIEDYLRMAEIWEAIAERFADRAELVDDQAAEIKRTIDHCREANLFLDRFRQHVATVPRLNGLTEPAEYLDKLQIFIKDMERFRTLFRGLHADLVKNSTCSRLRDRESIDQIAASQHADADGNADPSTTQPAIAGLHVYAGFGTVISAILIIGRHWHWFRDLLRALMERFKRSE